MMLAVRTCPVVTLTLAAATALMATLLPGVQADKTPLTHDILTHNSAASAMMLGLVDNTTALVMDKVEGNPTKLPNGKHAWASFVDLTTGDVRPVDVETNPFCAAGMILPNGSYVILGGNSAVS